MVTSPLKLPPPGAVACSQKKLDVEILESSEGSGSMPVVKTNAGQLSGSGVLSVKEQDVAPMVLPGKPLVDHKNEAVGTEKILRKYKKK